VVCDPERVRTRAHDLVRTAEEFLAASWAAAAAGGSAPVDLGAAAFKTLAEVRAAALGLGLPWWSVSPFGLATEPAPARDENPWDEPVEGLPAITEDRATTVALAVQPAPLYHGDTARVVDDLKQWAGDGWRVALVFEGQGPAQRAAEVLRDAGIGVSVVSTVDTPPAPGAPVVTTGVLGHGFLLDGGSEARMAVVTAADITGGRGMSTRDMRRVPVRRRNTIDPLELKAGDYVVHEQHGIGRYVELVQRTVNGADREYLVIEYAPSKRGQPGDRPFVPTDQLAQRSRYVDDEQ